MSDIPIARDRLVWLAQRLDAMGMNGLAREIQNDIVPLLSRRKPVRTPAPRKASGVDAATAKAIRTFAESNPGMSLQAIGEVFGVNAGRVSESLHRLR